MAKQVLRCTVNDEAVEVLVQPYKTLLDALRDDLNLTGPKEGCGTGDCGACTIHVDGKPVASCLMLAMQARGRSVRTIEGLGHMGVLMAASALLAENPHPTEEEIRYGIAGNLCRCTGYTTMVAAIAETAAAAPARKG